MTSESSVNLTEASYSIAEAATVIGKSSQTVRKYVKDGKFPNVFMAAGAKGDEYRIPAADLAALITEQGLTIHLDQSDHQSTDQSTPLLDTRLDELLENRQVIGQLTGQNEKLTSETTEQKRRITQLSNDVEQERTERQKLETRNAELDKAKAVAEARTEEVRKHLEDAQQTAAEHQEQIEQQAKALAERDAELVSMGDRSTELEEERSEALSEAARLKESMGWWSKRRFEKRQR